MATNLARLIACFEQAGLVVMEKEAYDSLLKTVERQAEEIDALDRRIKRLLDAQRKPAPVAPPMPPQVGAPL